MHLLSRSEFRLLFVFVSTDTIRSPLGIGFFGKGASRGKSSFGIPSSLGERIEKTKKRLRNATFR